MTRDEFSAAAFILGGSWPGEFTSNDEAAYWHMLSDFEAVDVIGALKAMRRAKFRPKPGEIAEALEVRAAVPTFDEMMRVVYGPRGILHARAPLRGDPAATLAAWEAYDDPDQTDTGAYRDWAFAVARDAAQTARAAEQHPLIASFVERMGLPRLRGYHAESVAVDIEGKRTDHWDRKELREAWERHAGVTNDREVAAIATRATRAELKHIQPLEALGIGKEPVQIGTGEQG